MARSFEIIPGLRLHASALIPPIPTDQWGLLSLQACPRHRWVAFSTWHTGKTYEHAVIAVEGKQIESVKEASVPISP